MNIFRANVLGDSRVISIAKQLENQRNPNFQEELDDPDKQTQ